MSGFTVVGFFLISLVFGLIIFSLWIRIALRYYRISTLSPMSQLIHALTDPLVRPLYPLFKPQASQPYDWLTFTVLVLIEFIKMICLSLLLFHSLLSPFSLSLFVLADLIIQPCNLLFYAILIRVIMSYVNPTWQHPIHDLLCVLTDPLLIWARKRMPNVGGFDLSPLLLLLILKVITLFISASLPGNLL